MNNITDIILKLRDEYLERENLSSYEEITENFCVEFGSELGDLIMENLDGEVEELSHDELITREDEDEWQGDGEDIWEESYIRDYNGVVPVYLGVHQLTHKIKKYHYWVMYEGKHYDAEEVNGVENFFDLPFFVRQFTGR